MIRIEFDLYAIRELHLVFLFICSDGAIHLRLNIRQKKFRLFFVQPDYGSVIPECKEILVAIEQAQTVYCGRVPIAIVVAHLKLLEWFVSLPQPHQVDAQFRTRRPQLWIGFDGFAVVGHCIVISAIQKQVVGHDGVGLAVARIHLLHFGQPRVRRTVRQHFYGGVNGHGVQGIGRNLQRLFGFGRGDFGIRILQR